MTLIYSTLTSLPIYQLSIFKAPIDFWKSIEKIWRNLLWKNQNEDKLTHLLRWNKITTSSDLIGLGIHRIAGINYSFLCKWLWRFQNEDGSLWKRVIMAKYTPTFIGDIPIVSKFSNIIKAIDWYNGKINWRVNNGESLYF